MKLRACLLVERSLDPFFRQIGQARSKENLGGIINPPCFLRVQEVGFAKKMVGFDELMPRDSPDPSKRVSRVVVGSELKRFPKGFIALGIPAFSVISARQRCVAADVERVERNCAPGGFNRRVEKVLVPAETLLLQEEARQAGVSQSKIGLLFDRFLKKLARLLVGLWVEKVH